MWIAIRSRAIFLYSHVRAYNSYATVSVPREISNSLSTVPGSVNRYMNSCYNFVQLNIGYVTISLVSAKKK